MGTTEQVEAGRDLDAQVHELVMGQRVEWRTVRATRGDYREPRGLLPCYSTDIAAAWQVVEKLHGEGLTFVLANSSGPALWEAVFDNSADEEFNAWAATAPLAICRAALAATAGAPTRDVPSTGEQP